MPEGRKTTWECGDPYSGIGCPEPDCTHRPEGWPENATMGRETTHSHRFLHQHGDRWLCSCGAEMDEANMGREATPWKCEAAVFSGPGHQSRTRCNRPDPHPLDGDHYVTEVVSEWSGSAPYFEEYYG